MELWVRSQNKEKLVKIDRVEYYEGYDPIDEYDGFTTHEILANKEEIELGQYKTKKRCLEIIDEIQKLLVPHLALERNGVEVSAKEFAERVKNGCIAIEPYEKVDYVQPLDTAVYEMPQE